MLYFNKLVLQCKGIFISPYCEFGWITCQNFKNARCGRKREVIGYYCALIYILSRMGNISNFLAMLEMWLKGGGNIVFIWNKLDWDENLNSNWQHVNKL